MQVDCKQVLPPCPERPAHQFFICEWPICFGRIEMGHAVHLIARVLIFIVKGGLSLCAGTKPPGTIASRKIGSTKTFRKVAIRCPVPGILIAAHPVPSAPSCS